MSEKKEVPNLFNLVDNLVKIRNTYKDYEPKNKKTIEFLMLEDDFNKTIRGIQNFYNYIDYDKLINDVNSKDFIDNNER